MVLPDHQAVTITIKPASLRAVAHPTAPQAYRPSRTQPEHLLAKDLTLTANYRLQTQGLSVQVTDRPWLQEPEQAPLPVVAAAEESTPAVTISHASFAFSSGAACAVLSPSPTLLLPSAQVLRALSQPTCTCGAVVLLLSLL